MTPKKPFRLKKPANLIALVVCLLFLLFLKNSYGVRFHIRSAFIRVVTPFSDWKERLYTPTLITRIGSIYFIVDCWHNRVLYNYTLDAPLSQWRILDDDLAGPHSIASDSILYAVDDTGRDSLRVYTYVGDRFRLVQTISGLGRNTDRVEYDPVTSAFYLMSAASQEITKLARKGDQLSVLYKKKLSFLNGSYTRSFTILDGFMFFVSGPKTITKARYVDDSYQVVETYPVPPSLADMNDLFKIGSYFYLTAMPHSIIRTKSLQDLQEGDWQDVYGTLGLKGTPYYLVQIDDRIFVPEMSSYPPFSRVYTGYSGILSFVDRNGAIEDVRTLIDSGHPHWMDRQIGMSLPK